MQQIFLNRQKARSRPSNFTKLSAYSHPEGYCVVKNYGFIMELQILAYASALLTKISLVDSRLFAMRKALSRKPDKNDANKKEFEAPVFI
jgi:hypothetical protein